MGEKYNVVDGGEIVYEGLFELSQIYHFINRFFEERGYAKDLGEEIEKKETKEKILESKIKYSKQFDAYSQVIFEIKIISEIKGEKRIKKGGSLRKAEEGKIKISFRVDLETDYEGRWNNLPHLFLFRWFYDMFIGKRYILSYIELSKKDYEELRAEIKVLLGIENYLKKF